MATQLPTLFVSHGSPMLLVDQSDLSHAFFKSLGSTFVNCKPKAILIVSAHWENSKQALVSTSTSTIHDFYGFPDELYQIRYSPPTSPWLADKVVDALTRSNIPCAADKHGRGLDHGAWIPLRLMFPDADVPVTQLSLIANLDARTHLDIGKALAPLRDEGVLIIGSGSMTHNLSRFRIPDGSGHVADWSKGFDDFVTDTLLNKQSPEREQILADFREHKYAKIAHPRVEHFVPIFVPLGAAIGGRASKIHDLFYGDLSMAAWKFE